MSWIVIDYRVLVVKMPDVVFQKNDTLILT